MASIKLNNLSKNKIHKSNNGQIYDYVDIYLDFQSDKVSNNLQGVNNERDLRVATDEGAIKNSIINLFNTTPGQRILVPEYGFKFLNYIFDKISTYAGRALADHVANTIRKWEPRVNINHIKVLVDENNQEYHVILDLSVPSLKDKKISISGIMNSSEFITTDTSNFA
jgi:phage baseplate assembly protein W